MFSILGINRGLDYSDYTRINIYMTEADALSSVEEIVKDSFNGKFSIAYTDKFKDTITIKAQRISDEEIDNLKNKLTEKFQFDNINNESIIIKTPEVSFYDIIKNYIKPMIISFILVILYLTLIHRKQGILKAFLKPFIIILIILGLYLSAVVILRIPVNLFVISIGIFLYIISILLVTVVSKNEGEN